MMFHLRMLIPQMGWIVLAGIALVGNPTTELLGQDDTNKSKVTYDDHVRAIFAQRCASCHNMNKKSGDLDVTNYTSLMQGGSSGAVIERGDLDFSYLYQLLTHAEEPVMPPGGKIPRW